MGRIQGLAVLEAEVLVDTGLAGDRGPVGLRQRGPERHQLTRVEVKGARSAKEQNKRTLAKGREVLVGVRLVVG
jgi:hypothetical protein